jgi:predicted acyltransferase
MNTPAQRLLSLDAFRGFVMLLMASSGLGLAQMAAKNPDSSLWQAIGWQVSHVPWQGCALWDLIQPSFMFMVGLAVPLSLSRRLAEGQSKWGISLHALIRAVVLVLLAVLLSTRAADKQTQWIFTNVLAQIGLGYVPLVLLVVMGWEYCLAAVLVILVGDAAWFLTHPGPSAETLKALASLQAPAEAKLEGFFSAWSIHTNAAAEFDRWLLNLFPRAEVFVANGGGYQTLNFIPALATMLGGALTGHFLMRPKLALRSKCLRLVMTGVALLVLGALLGWFACPIVKRIWTPSWAIFSAGWVLLMLSFFYGMVELRGWRRAVFPLAVVGSNSIFIYVMHSLCAGWIGLQLAKHGMSGLFASSWGPVWERGSVLLVLWLMCLWLYRQRAFLRI